MIENGIPQGRVIRPLLFISMINDVFRRIQIFADVCLQMMELVQRRKALQEVGHLSGG